MINKFIILNEAKDFSSGIFQNYLISQLKSTLNICKAKNVDLDKYKYSGCDIGFDSHSEFSFRHGIMEKI